MSLANIMTMNAYPVYRTPILLWGLAAVGLMLAIVSAYSALSDMVGRWETSEEYGYGYMIPVITLFLIWQRKDKLEIIPFTGSWLGLLVLIIGMLITIIGQLSAIYTVTQYGFVIVLLGAMYAVLGHVAFKMVFVPILLLFLMVPLPGFVFNNLSAHLQLISSEIGVAVIRLFDISVYLEGNVIDLGNYKLQVIEACSGLRYLFPLMALAIIASYFYQAAVWKRVVLILSSIPITVLMNSLRIGVIGVLVEYYGNEQAEGFLHDFEGWIVFMACVMLLVLEVWLLSFLGGDKRPFSEIFGMELPEPTPEDADTKIRGVPIHTYLSVLVLVVGVIGVLALGGRQETIPNRAEFSEFPVQIDEWTGQNLTMETEILDVLKLDDYLLADYVNNQGRRLNLYVAYYGSQRSGASAHSPRTCLPGGGWRIDSNNEVDIGDGLKANRFLISMGEQRMLVYYWFKQRDRILTNEFAVKWYLLWDSITKNRTDGALIRVTMVMGPGDDMAAADQRVVDFIKSVSTSLNQYVPG